MLASIHLIARICHCYILYLTHRQPMLLEGTMNLIIIIIIIIFFI